MLLRRRIQTRRGRTGGSEEEIERKRGRERDRERGARGNGYTSYKCVHTHFITINNNLHQFLYLIIERLEIQ